MSVVLHRVRKCVCVGVCASHSSFFFSQEKIKGSVRTLEVSSMAVSVRESSDAFSGEKAFVSVQEKIRNVMNRHLLG